MEVRSRYEGKLCLTECHCRVSPLKTYSIYTEYDSDEHGDYSYFVGEAVSDFSDQNLETFNCLTIPAQQYQRFTTQQGEIPKIIIEAWQEIWKKDALKEKRNYLTDFELFDDHCKDPTNAELDIYIGVKSN